MRKLTMIAFLWLLFPWTAWAGVEDDIREDIAQRQADDLSTRAYSGEKQPQGLRLEQGWSCQRDQHALEQYILQDAGGQADGVTVVGLYCADCQRYWVRVRGTVLDLDLWYGPSSASGWDSQNAQSQLQRAIQPIKNTVPALAPKGIVEKKAYHCIQHRCATVEYSLGRSISPIPEGLQLTAYYCAKGNHYWLRLADESQGAHWWLGPFSITPAPSANLQLLVKVGKERYEMGEPIHIQVYVKNRSSKGVRLQFRSGVQGDYSLDNRYRWSKNHAGVTMITEQYIPAQREVKILDQRHQSADHYLAPGTHTIVGLAEPMNYNSLRSSPVQIEVVESSIPPENSAELMSRALRLMKKGQYAQARSLIEEILRREPDNANAHYNLACLESLDGQSDKALVHLEQAMIYGFLDFDHIAGDDDLDNIRQLRKFHYLIKKYQVGMGSED